MKNSILFLTAIFILISNTLVFGQYENTLQDKSHIGTLTQNDLFSIEILSIFRMMSEELSNNYNNEILSYTKTKDELSNRYTEITIDMLINNNMSYGKENISSFEISPDYKLAPVMHISSSSRNLMQSIAEDNTTSIMHLPKSQVAFKKENNHLIKSMTDQFSNTHLSIGTWQFSLSACDGSEY